MAEDKRKSAVNVDVEDTAGDDEPTHSKKAEEEAAAKERKRIADHTAAESKNWVKVKKGEEVLSVHRDTLQAHKVIGFVEV